ncbi:MAG: type II toxin-antitoxin system Phd/YefM family antitoxin [Desulfuromonadales bacterium]|nr:type II toxin-antitoxin system Phd/YefM family antitoxin [Desulfuromonadales bacterium]
MNAIPANELKRHGISAIEKLLSKGPVHVIKRNQPVCVVLAEDEYERLVLASGAIDTQERISVMEWFSLSVSGTAGKSEIDERLAEERGAWDKR